MLSARLRQFTATLLVAAWMYGTGLPLLTAHPEGDDVACGEISLNAGHGATSKVGVAVAPKGDGHCAVCHLQRTLSHALCSALSAIGDLGRPAREAAAPQVVAIARSADRSSSRGPPSA